jgi:hypothetical protein
VTAPTANITDPAASTHGCARCGRPVAIDVGLCDECNPLGLRDVAASQVHGTVFIMILLGFVALAVVAHLAITGVGPFPASISAASAVDGGLRVTLTVTNEGARDGGTTCRVFDPTDRAGGPSEQVITPQIAGGATVEYPAILRSFGLTPRSLAVECRTP